jgi:hypothetical protein
MTLTLSKILVIIAVICFVLTAIGFMNLLAVGLAFFAGSALA